MAPPPMHRAGDSAQCGVAIGLTLGKWGYCLKLDLEVVVLVKLCGVVDELDVTDVDLWSV